MTQSQANGAANVAFGARNLTPYTNDTLPVVA